MLSAASQGIRHECSLLPLNIFFANSLLLCPSDLQLSIKITAFSTSSRLCLETPKDMVYLPCIPCTVPAQDEQLSPPHSKWFCYWGMLDRYHYTHSRGAPRFGVWAWFKGEEDGREGNVCFFSGETLAAVLCRTVLNTLLRQGGLWVQTSCSSVSMQCSGLLSQARSSLLLQGKAFWESSISITLGFFSIRARLMCLSVLLILF